MLNVNDLAADEILRTVPLLDLEITRGGTGREVTAYCAVFDVPAEIRDQHGHYHEVIHRSAFNRAISHGFSKVKVLYNHGRTVDGEINGLAQVPLGKPLEIRPDGKGLLTIVRFNHTDLAEATLQAIKDGDITGYSFRGRVFNSSKTRARAGGLPTVTRQEMGLSEFGPTPSPYYEAAGVVSVRATL